MVESVDDEIRKFQEGLDCRLKKQFECVVISNAGGSGSGSTVVVNVENK